MSETFTIGKLAQATGTNVETVRWYEKVGLIAAPARTSGNYRTYEKSALARLGFIRRARDLGFSLDEVRTMLDLAGRPDQDCASVDRVATIHLTDIDRKISDLKALRGELASLIASCRGGAIAECRILDAFSHNPQKDRETDRFDRGDPAP